MSWTEGELDALRRAYAAGALVVEYDGRRQATAGQLATAARENGAWNQMRPYLEALASSG